MRETRSDHQLSPPLVQVHADSELGLASLLGLAPGSGAAHGPQLRAGVFVAVVFCFALALFLLSLGAVL
ncbi:hypothetical protein [Nocardioides sp.]|uniref:hypothetical protein n=1 Tax=Nocardioides sp. TaxID=35761 RepID=UPI001A336019|nr:hypothetical protein [Nocardioides sp.]MBJ7357894.1 hypothetical protein [Nocardioides sp.]